MGTDKKLQSESSDIIKAIKRLAILSQLPSLHNNLVSTEFDKILATHPHILSLMKRDLSAEFQQLKHLAQENNRKKIYATINSTKIHAAKKLNLKLTKPELDNIRESYIAHLPKLEIISPFPPEDNNIEDLPKYIADRKNTAIKNILENTKESKIKAEKGTEWLVLAISNNNTIALELLLQHLPKEQINSTYLGTAPLHAAVADKNLSAIEIFLQDEKVNRSVKDSQGKTPFYRAASTGDPYLLKIFLRFVSVEELNETNAENANILHRCVWSNHIVNVRIFLEDGRIAINQSTKTHGSTPFQQAAYNGYDQILVLLLEKLTLEEINHLNKSGESALHLAVKQNRISTTRILLELPEAKQLPLNLKDTYDYTAFQYALIKNYPQIVSLFLPKMTAEEINHITIGDMPMLFFVVDSGHNSVLNILLNDSRVRVGITNKYGRTCLHLAIDNGHLDMVTPLMARMTADEINTLEKTKNFSVLHYAAYNSDPNFVSKVLENKQTQVAHSVSPLSVAANEGHLETLKTLLADDRIKLAENVLKPSPLYFAAREGHVQVVELLLEVMSAEQINTEHFNAFYIAIFNSQLEVIKSFLNSNKLNVNFLSEGASCLHMAAIKGDTQILALLLEHPIKIEITRWKGNTPVELALARHPTNLELLKLLSPPNEVAEIKKNIASPGSSIHNIMLNLQPEKKRQHPAFSSTLLMDWKHFLKKHTVSHTIKQMAKNLIPELDEKSSRYLPQASDAYDKKITVSDKKSSFYLTPPSDQALHEAGYYKLSAPDLEKKMGVPIFAFVPETTRKKADVTAWEFIEKQLKSGPKIISSKDHESIGVKQLASGKHELANKSSKGSANPRIIASEGFSAPQKILGQLDACVITFNRYAKNHKRLKKKCKQSSILPEIS